MSIHHLAMHTHTENTCMHVKWGVGWYGVGKWGAVLLKPLLDSLQPLREESSWLDDYVTHSYIKVIATFKHDCPIDSASQWRRRHNALSGTKTNQCSRLYTSWCMLLATSTCITRLLCACPKCKHYTCILCLYSNTTKKQRTPVPTTNKPLTIGLPLTREGGLAALCFWMKMGQASSSSHSTHRHGWVHLKGGSHSFAI